MTHLNLDLENLLREKEKKGNEQADKKGNLKAQKRNTGKYKNTFSTKLMQSIMKTLILK